MRNQMNIYSSENFQTSCCKRCSRTSHQCFSMLIEGILPHNDTVGSIDLIHNDITWYIVTRLKMFDWLLLNLISLNFTILKKQHKHSKNINGQGKRNSLW